jgi:hypothetical protein
MTDIEKKKVDEDWKRQASLEKEAAAVEAEEGTANAAPYEGQMNFSGLVSMLATQAMLFLGAIPDPQTGQTRLDLEQARIPIDTLEMLKEKTKGNLSTQEAEQFKQVLSDLRMAYVQVSRQPQDPPEESPTG